jgi:hypothetical protein
MWECYTPIDTIVRPISNIMGQARKTNPIGMNPSFGKSRHDVTAVAWVYESKSTLSGHRWNMDSAPFKRSVRLASALPAVAQGCKCCSTSAAYTLMSISVGAKWPPCYRLNTPTTQVEHKMSRITDLSKQIYPEGTKRTAELKWPQLQGYLFSCRSDDESSLSLELPSSGTYIAEGKASESA